MLIIEKERQFRDRVRGEGIWPWGVYETKKLGIYELLRDTCGHEVRWFTRTGSHSTTRRDFIETTPYRLGALDFYHPEMQEVLIQAAEQAGADVWRGAVAVGVGPGRPPGVTVKYGDRETTLAARLVVAADGRNSKVRVLSGFQIRRDPERLVVAGVLLSNLAAPEDSVQYFHNTKNGQASLIFPIGKRRYRSYFIYRKQGKRRPLSGHKFIDHYFQSCIGAGTPGEWFEDVEVAGPLASFEGADVWVEHPYEDGIALVGDAAAAGDPTYGCGLSLTLRDARVLGENLLANDDWEAAAHAYAEEQDRYYGALHRITGWMTELYFDLGTEADERRRKVLSIHAEEPSRSPDYFGLGPEAPSDEQARMRFFAEDKSA